MDRPSVTKAPEAEDEVAPRDAWFDPWRRPGTSKAAAIVEDVQRQLENYERHFALRKRRRRAADQRIFDDSVAAVVCNLIHRELVVPDGKLAISLSNQLLGRAGRYGSPVMSKVLPDLLERMATPDMAWLSLSKGQRGYFGTGRVTTIQAAPRLVSRLSDSGVQFEDLKRVNGDEVIVLKRSKDDAGDGSDYLDYADTLRTKAFRQEVQRINEWLEQADIDFDGMAALEKNIDPSDRRLRRYFNNGSFDQGGRLFGGFWQGLKKQERHEGIWIGGERVVTLDYAQMAPRILYGMVGKQPPESDCYRIPGLEFHRDGVKKLFAAAMFSDSLSRAPQGTRKLLPGGMSVGHMVDLIKTHHQPIADLLFTGIGFQEMYRESEILIDALIALIEQNVVALPIHDALVVSSGKLTLARDTMLSIFKEHTGVEGLVSVEDSN
jgi:hypothetical protein